MNINNNENEEVNQKFLYKGKKNSVTGLKEDFGEYIFENTFFKYIGEFKNNKRNGKGKIIMKSGQEIEGTFIDDEIIGQGVIKYPNGDYYEGDLYLGEKNGFGKEKKNEFYYEGEFHLNSRNGKGTLKNKNHLIKGEFKNNKLDGYCFEYLDDKLIYEGEFKNNLKNGICKFYFDKSFIYSGEINNDIIEGKGEIEYLDTKLKYKGNFKDFKPLSKPNNFEVIFKEKLINKIEENEEVEEIKNIEYIDKINIINNKNYIIIINSVFIGDDIPNPNYNPNNKKKNVEEKEFIKPEPILIEEESNRKFEIKIWNENDSIVKFDYFEIYNDWKKNNDSEFNCFIKENDNKIEYNLFQETDINNKYVIYKANLNGNVEFDFKLPNNYPNGNYKLIINNLCQEENIVNNELIFNLLISNNIINNTKKK